MDDVVDANPLTPSTTAADDSVACVMDVLGAFENGPSVVTAEPKASSELSLARDALAAAEACSAALAAERDTAHSKLDQWNMLAAALSNAVLLSPAQTRHFANVARTLLTQAVEKLAFIDKLRWVDCSFPAAPANAPKLTLVKFESLAKSQWTVDWCPLWTCDVNVDARQLGVRYNMLVRVAKLRLRGTLHVEATPDLADVAVAFADTPDVDLHPSCTLTLGQLTLPQLSILEDNVKLHFLSWLQTTMCAPNRLLIAIDAFKRKRALTDTDVQNATEAALAAAERAVDDPTRVMC